MTHTPVAPARAGNRRSRLAAPRDARLADTPEAPEIDPETVERETVERDPARGASPKSRAIPAARRSRADTVRAYVALTKPRIIELLLVTTVPAMILAAEGLPDWLTVLITLIGGTLAAGSANALNCYLDRDIDALMHRTGHRPLARHQVSDTGALVFGAALGVVSVSMLWLGANALAGLLTLGAIAFYVLGYTWLLKRRTSQNIVWGGAAGCMPMLIGWSAVTGDLSWAPVVLFLVVFFWTPPHFWALAIKYKDDYARAGVPMLPVVATPLQVARQIVAYSVLTAATSVALWPLATGPVYGMLAVVAGVWLVAESAVLLRAVRGGAAGKPMRLFHFSNSYLAFLFVAVAVDTFLR